MTLRQLKSAHLQAFLAAGALAACASNVLAYDWLQFNGNPQHDGNTTREVRLDASNVNQLTRSYQSTLPAVADGAPVFLEQVTTASGVKDLLFVNTTQGHILALNAQTGATVWSKQFAFSSAATSTSPAIDPNRQYVYTYGREGYVHKLLVGDGSEVTTGGWPQLVTLKPAVEKVSSALATATVAGTNYLYVATSGYPGDAGDYQGHVVAINLATGAQKVFNTLCSEQTVHFAQFPALPDCTSQKQTGAWGRPGVIYDAGTNRIFMATGNGKYDAANNHWGDSVLALTPDGAGAGGKPIDAYTPATFQALQNADADLGSTAPAVLPVPLASNVQHLAVQGGKDSLLRLINLADLSGQGGPGHTGGEIGGLGINVGGQVLSQPAVWVNPADSTTWVFIANGSSSAYRLSIAANGNPSLVSQWTGGNGGNSSPLVANNVLYVASGSTLRALNPTTKAQLWASAASAIGSIKWQSPVVANCAVYILDQSSHLSAFTLPAALSTLPMKLAVTSINGGANPLAGVPFNVVVQALDCASAAQNVTINTGVTLALAIGTGVLGGTLTCTIPAGFNSCTVTGVTYSVAEPSVVVTATRTSGDVLGAGASAPFAVGGPGVVSRKVHGGAGTFDLPLGVVVTNPTTEPRAGPAHAIVFTFVDAVTSAGTAVVTEGTAAAGTPTFSGSELTVPLTGVTDAQYVTLTVSNVALAGGGTGGGTVRIGFLLGDVSQNRVVTVGDLAQVNAQLARPVTAANYLADVNANGTSTLADKGLTNANLTRSLPPP
jgi:hypothetical protein